MKLLEKHVQLENLTIRYLEGGTPSRSPYPILLLHGWGLSPDAFKAGLRILSQNYRVIAPDLPGFGKSKHPTSLWNYDDFAKAIVAFIRVLDIKQAHLIGQSTGGGVCIALVASSPALVRSIILIDSTGIPLGSFSKLLLRRIIELPAQAWATNFTRHHIDMLQAFFYNLLFRFRNLKGLLELPLKSDLRPLLSRIKVPCLITWGAKDITVPLSSGQEFSRRIEGAKIIVISGAHHEWSVLLPEKLAAITSEFINEVQGQE